MNVRFARMADVWKTLDRIRSALGMSSVEMAEILHLTQSEFRQMRLRSQPLSLFSATRLIQNFNLTWESFVFDRIDYKAMAEHKSGNLGYIPERYLLGAFSKIRTVASFLEYVKYFRGPMLRNKALRHFQITDKALENGSNPINIIFMKDLLTFLKDNNFNNSDFVGIGAFSAVTNQGSSLHSALGYSKSVGEAYERLIVDLVRYYEHNCDYRMLKTTKTGCVVESTTSRALLDAHRSWTVGSTEICSVRAGILASVPSYLDRINSKVIETNCVHRGDHSCKFEVEYNLTKRLSFDHAAALQ